MTDIDNFVLAIILISFAAIGFWVVVYKIIQFTIWIEKIGNAFIQKHKNKQQS